MADKGFLPPIGPELQPHQPIEGGGRGRDGSRDRTKDGDRPEVRGGIVFLRWETSTTIVLVTALVVPLLIWGILTLVRNWGVWKVRSPKPRPHYIKTWHGWVNAEKHAEKKAKRRTLGSISRQDGSLGTTTPDYSWIFWDPTGEKRKIYEQQRRQKSILRFLPASIRKYLDVFAAFGPPVVPNELSTAEDGRISVHSFQHDAQIQRLGVSRCRACSRTYREQNVNGQFEGFDSLSSIFSDDGSPHSSDGEAAISLGEESSYRRQHRQWEDRGHGVAPTDCSQCLSSQQANITSVESDVPNANGALVLDLEKIQVPHPSSITHGIAHRTFSLHAILSLLRPTRSLWPPSSSDSSSRHSVDTPKLYPGRNPEGPVAPHNSDDVPRSGPATPQRRYCRSEVYHAEFAAEKPFAEDLCERLSIWAKPIVLDPYKSIGPEYGGTCGRPTSPAMGWLVGRESMDDSSSGFGGEGQQDMLSRRTAFPGCNTCSPTSFDRYSLNEVQNYAPCGTEAKSRFDSCDSRATCKSHHSAKGNLPGSSSSGSVFQGNHSLRHICITPSPPDHQRAERVIRKYSTLPARRTQVSARHFLGAASLMPSLNSFGNGNGNSGTWPMMNAVKLPVGATSPTLSARAPSSPSHSPPACSTMTPVAVPGVRKQFPDVFLDSHRPLSPELNPITSRSTAEEIFLDDLRRRLQHLHYELSPGLHGPRGREAACQRWYQAVPYSVSVAEDNTYANVSGCLAPKRPLNLPLRADMRSQRPKTCNRANMHCSLHSERCKPWRGIQSEKLRSRPLDDEPAEHLIDTAAWIPRRPPMYARRSLSAEQDLLFTCGHIRKPRTLAEWQRRSPRQHHRIAQSCRVQLRAASRRMDPRRFTFAKPVVEEGEIAGRSKDRVSG